MALPIIDQIADNVTLTLAAPDHYTFTLAVSGGSLDGTYTVDRVTNASWASGTTRSISITQGGGLWQLTVNDSILIASITFTVTATGNLVPPLTGWAFSSAGGLPGPNQSVSNFSKLWDMNNQITVVDDLKTAHTSQDGLTQVSYDDPAVEEDGPLNHEQFLAGFHVLVTLGISTATDVPLTEKAYQIEADIIKRLLIDWTRGGLAVDTIPLAATVGTLGESGGWAVVSVNFNVRYRTLYGDRFNQ